jgi:hypothetical protein
MAVPLFHKIAPFLVAVVEAALAAVQVTLPHVEAAVALHSEPRSFLASVQEFGPFELLA